MENLDDVWERNGHSAKVYSFSLKYVLVFFFCPIKIGKRTRFNVIKILEEI